MSKVILIRVSGPDQLGITHRITTVLTRIEATILDIGQAVIHSNLALGMLVKIADSDSTDLVYAEVSKALAGSALTMEIDNVSAEDYNEWVGLQGKPRHIVTLLAPQVRAEHIARLTSELSESGVNIDKIHRLSGRAPLEATDSVGDEHSDKMQACVEFSIRGAFDDEQRVRSSLLQLSAEMNIDIAVQLDNMYRRNRRLVAFDMDSTLIDREVIDELAVEAGIGDQVAAITESAMRGELDFNQSFEKRMGLLKGLDEAALDRVYQRLQLNDGVEKLMAGLKKLGYKTAILSGGFTYFAERLQQRLGFDYVYANTLEIVDGVVTGRAIPPVVNGARKAELLQEIAKQENLSMEQVIAIGDGANDLPMLSLAGLGVAFRAKPLVKQKARQSISTLGLDAVLYLLGISDQDRL